MGQASQPIFSINFGARQWERIRQTLRYALLSAAFFGLAWTALILQFPNGFIRIFMNPTAEVLAVGPSILRAYGISFLLLPFNIFSTYYFQSLMKPRASFFVSVFRGVLVSGLLIWFLPLFMGAGALWFAMPVTELLVAAAVVYLIVKYTKELPVK